MRAFGLAARFAGPLRALGLDRGGAAAVEAALVFPVLILLSFGAIELGGAIWAQASMHHAVKETARFASVRGAASGAAAATEDQLEAMAVQLAELPPTTLIASTSWNPDNLPGSVVTVQLQHTYTPITLPFASDGFTFSSTASMTIVR